MASEFELCVITRKNSEYDSRIFSLNIFKESESPYLMFHVIFFF